MDVRIAELKNIYVFEYDEDGVFVDYEDADDSETVEYAIFNGKFTVCRNCERMPFDQDGIHATGKEVLSRNWYDRTGWHYYWRAAYEDDVLEYADEFLKNHLPQAWRDYNRGLSTWEDCMQRIRYVLSVPVPYEP